LLTCFNHTHRRVTVNANLKVALIYNQGSIQIYSL